MSNTVTVQIQAQLEWRAGRSPTSGRWVAVCDAMNLAMEADSLDELHSLIHESIQLMLTDLLEDDELDAFLNERGWSAAGVPAPQQRRDVSFDVPWELIAAGSHDTERRPH